MMPFVIFLPLTVFLYIASIGSLILTTRVKQLEMPHRSLLMMLAITGVLWISALFAGWKLARTLASVPVVVTTNPKPASTIDPTHPDIVFSFSAPVSYKTLAAYSYPEVELEIKPSNWLSKFLGFGSQVRISPKTTLESGKGYIFYLANTEGPLTRGYGGEYQYEFATKTQSITQIEPQGEATDIAPDQTFTVHLSLPPRSDEDWNVIAEANLALDIYKNGPETMIIKPREKLRESTQLKFKVIYTEAIVNRADGSVAATREPQTLGEYSYEVVKHALVASYSPQGQGVNPAEDIIIVFDQEMDTKSVEENLRIEPEINPRIWWVENKTLTISHNTLEKDTDYTLTLGKGLRSAKGGSLEKDIVFSFRTAGPLKITQTVPQNDAQSVASSTPITIRFDQEVPKNISEKISISPTIEGTFETRTTEVIFTPKSTLPQQTKYTVSLASGASGIHGTPSTEVQSFSFSTDQNRIGLSVPYYKQLSSFTCNIAAARMLLAYRDVMVSEADLIDKIGRAGKRGSGNPNRGYVDDYGTYWDAILRGVQSYRSARLISGNNIADLTAELARGNPVMIWGQNGWSDPHDISWTASDGTQIRAINGMHSAVVRGFVGQSDAPTQILVNDPWRGQYAINTAEFMRRWKFFSMALVVE